MSEARVAALEALLVTVDAAIAAAEPREVASLSREKRQLLAELDALAGTVKGSLIDDLDRRRAARLAKTAVRAPAGGGAKQRGKRSG